MNSNRNPFPLRVGIVLHGKKIWISEFVSIIFLGLLVCCLLATSVLILINEAAIHGRDARIAGLRRDKISGERLLGELTEQERIGAALKYVAGNSLSPSIYYQLVNLVYNNSKTFGYDPFLVLAVIKVESYFRQNALGRYRNLELSGALGFMQLMPGTAREIAENLGIKITDDAEIFKPEINLAVGVAYLAQCISRFRSFKLGVLAYNQGPEVIRQYLQGNQPLSIGYYSKVLKSYYELKKAVRAK